MASGGFYGKIPSQGDFVTRRLPWEFTSAWDDWLQQGVIDIDSSRSGGLVELEFPNGSKIVVNKQPPLHEIWLAARNGGFHFRFVDQAWRDTRDGVEFFARLSDEASRQGGKPLQFAAA